MSNEHFDLEGWRGDWQQRDVSLGEQLAPVRARLWRRWLLLAGDALGVVVAAAVLLWSLQWIDDAMDWLFWGFFLIWAMVLIVIGLRLRLRSWHLHSQAPADVLDWAMRDAAVRRRTGQLGLWATAIISAFVLLWWLIDGLFLGGDKFSWSALWFLLLWCGGFALFSLWMLRRGQRHLARLKELQSAMGD